MGIRKLVPSQVPQLKGKGGETTCSWGIRINRGLCLPALFEQTPQGYVRWTPPLYSNKAFFVVSVSFLSLSPFLDIYL